MLIIFDRRAKRGKVISVHRPETFWKAGFVPQHETAIIIHGFNGTQTSKHIQYLTNGNNSLDKINSLIDVTI